MRFNSPLLLPQPLPLDAQLARLGLLQLRDRESVRFCADPVTDATDGLMLFANGEQLDKAGRAKMLTELRGGSAPPMLEVEATAFLQRKDTPNRKFVRFADGIMSAFAKSYSGQPFLRDHNSYELEARGGTILSSKMVKLDDGTKAIQMRIQLVKLWAIEGVLDGTIDRFSIGWSRTDIVTCSVHKGQVFRECDCMPGQKLGDGKVVEFVFQGADGTEVSAVNVPAVVGTGIQAISQLDSLDRATLEDMLASERSPKREKTMDPQLLAALGLKPDATLADVLAAIKAQGDKLTIAEATNANNATRLSAIETENATRAKKERDIVVSSSLTSLINAGKIKPGSEVEQALRRTAERDLDVFSATVKDMLASGAQVTPIGSVLPAGSKDPVAAAPVLGSVLNGKDMLESNPALAPWLARAGITMEQFEKHGARGRETLAAVQAARG
jgi:hypothetical protein